MGLKDYLSKINDEIEQTGYNSFKDSYEIYEGDTVNYKSLLIPGSVAATSGLMVVNGLLESNLDQIIWGSSGFIGSTTLCYSINKFLEGERKAKLGEEIDWEKAYTNKIWDKVQ